MKYHHVLECRQCCLKNICFPSKMSEQETIQLEKSITQASPLKKNDILFSQGEKSECYYIVKSGCLKSYITDSMGVEQIVSFNFPGSLLGLAAVDRKRYKVTTVALQHSSVCKLSWKESERLTRECPNFHSQSLSMFSREMDQLYSTVKNTQQKGAKQKLAKFLLSISKQMTVYGFSESEFYLTMSRSDIANFLGITAESISRQITLLKEDGILEVERRHVKLLSIDGLKLIAE